MTQTAKTCAVIGTIVVVIGVSWAIGQASGDPMDASSPKYVGKPSPRSAILDAWSDAGLEAGGFASVSVDALSEAYCERGSVSALEVTLCAFPNIESASAASDKVEPLIGNSTGAYLSAGTMLVVATDRYNSDRDGRKLNTLLNTFRSTAKEQTL